MDVYAEDLYREMAAASEWKALEYEAACLLGVGLSAVRRYMTTIETAAPYDTASSSM